MEKASQRSKNDASTTISSPRPTLTENQNVNDSKTLNGGRCTRRRVPMTVKVFPEYRERLKFWARELGSSECELEEGLIEGLDNGLSGRAVMSRISRETYVFVDFTLNRTTEKYRRFRDKYVLEDRITQEFHGDKDHCFICNKKPSHIVFAKDTPLEFPKKVHVEYVCQQHHKPELQRLTCSNLLYGHRPL